MVQRMEKRRVDLMDQKMAAHLVLLRARLKKKEDSMAFLTLLKEFLTLTEIGLVHWMALNLN